LQHYSQQSKYGINLSFYPGGMHNDSVYTWDNIQP
jgi:hypothetical protein